MSKDRPILFSGEMVRAILAGDKTQTRRVVRLPAGAMNVRVDPALLGAPGNIGVKYDMAMEGDVFLRRVRCPYGLPGDTLWVRETWRPVMYAWSSCIEYAAGGSMDIKGRREYDALRNCKRIAIRIPKRSPLAHHSEAWHPSIHMPRWASRLTLRVTSVRVERLHDISDADCKAEGIYHGCDRDPYEPARDIFACLWDEINGQRAPWASNPWVWVIGFEREGTR